MQYLKIRIKPAPIENMRRIEGGFQAAMNFHQRAGQRRKHASLADFPVAGAGAEQGCMTARLAGRHTHQLRIGFGNPPALRTAPFH